MQVFLVVFFHGIYLTHIGPIGGAIGGDMEACMALARQSAITVHELAQVSPDFEGLAYGCFYQTAQQTAHPTAHPTAPGVAL